MTSISTIIYLLKPYSDQRFEHAIARARKYIESAEARVRAEELAAALKSAAASTPVRVISNVLC